MYVEVIVRYSHNQRVTKLQANKKYSAPKNAERGIYVQHHKASPTEQETMRITDSETRKRRER